MEVKMESFFVRTESLLLLGIVKIISTQRVRTVMNILMVRKSCSVFPVLHMIFCLQLSDENLVKQRYCDDRNLDYILTAFMLLYV